MISSVPLPQVPLSQTALYQMCCDMADIIGAGWKMEITPDFSGNPYAASVLFKRARPLPETENIPAAYHVVRFALANDLPTVVKMFHTRIFPIPPEGTLPPSPTIE